MDVQVAIFYGDHVLCKGTIHVHAEEERDELRRGDGGVSLESIPSDCKMTRVILSHKFGLPACGMDLELYETGIESSLGEERSLQAGIAMVVHASEDWESVALGPEYDLAFRCIPLLVPT